jgi:hypothetical protein
MTSHRKRHTTTHQRIQATGRMIYAAGRSVAREDPEQLAELVGLQFVLDAAIRLAIVGLREDFTWQSIADALGVSRQACIMRWGQLARDAGADGPRA